MTNAEAESKLPQLPEGYSYQDVPNEQRLDLRAPNGEIVAHGFGTTLEQRLRSALAEISTE